MLPSDPLQPVHIFITAGDPSGDAHAARLMAAIRTHIPTVVFEGFGGPEMELQGLRSLAHIRDLAVTGFWEVAKRYRFFRSLLNRCDDAIARTRPVAFIPVDYPGFNMRLAARVRARKTNRVPVFWYIAPQLWAWGERRATKLAAAVDRLFVVFPFEVEFFQRHGIRAEYVGHPLAEEIPVDTQGRVPGQVLLMPGSRAQELHHHTGLLADVVDRVRAHRSDVSFVVARARNIDLRALEPLVQRNVDVVDDAHAAMQTASAGIIKAGTSTLEAAFRGLPFATFYRTSPLSYAISKRLVTVTSVTMMNLLLKRNVVHEYIQHDATSTRIADEIETLLDDSARRTELVTAMSDVREMLSGEGASKRTAALIVEALRR
jgi:lipid-A-disaccharide synthase